MDRHAGLMALSTIGEGCKKVMEAKIVEIVDSIVEFLRDPHPRVRYAACNALGQMSTDFAPVIEKKCHAKVVPSPFPHLTPGEVVVAVDGAGAAVGAGGHGEPAGGRPRRLRHRQLRGGLPQAHPHRPPGPADGEARVGPPADLQGSLLRAEKAEVEEWRKLQMLEGGKKLVLEQVVTTIASVADTAQDHYVRYYDRVMPALKYILANATASPDLRLLRGKCVECISLIGLAVGKEKFGPDAGEVMELLVKTQAELGSEEASADADDPSTSYIISASARICKLLGPDFAPYLPIVMPAVIKAAEFKPEVTMVEAEEGGEMAGDEDWTFVGLGDQSMLGIRTAGLEDKANACQMLVCYARELKAAFADYVEPVTKLMVPLLKFYFHDGVRSAAADALPFLLEAAAASARGPEFVSSMWEFIFPDLIQACESEPENEVSSAVDA